MAVIGKKMMVNKKMPMKQAALEESKESPNCEMEEMATGESLKHPELSRELGDNLTNHQAHFLYHPKLGAEHSQWDGQSNNKLVAKKKGGNTPSGI